MMIFLRTILFLSLFTISLNIFSYSVYGVGQIESKEWNDYAEKFYDYPLKIYAGYSPDLSEKHIKIEIKNSFGDDYFKGYTLKKCNERQIKKNKCDSENFLINRQYEGFEYLKNILRKSIEWSEVAIENKVEKISKNLEIDGKKLTSPFADYRNAQFYVNSKSKQTELILPTKLPLKGISNRYYGLVAQKEFLRLLEIEVPNILKKSLEKSNEINLFN